MAGRISVEELRPVGAARAEARAARRAPAARFSGELRLEPRDAGGILDNALDGLLARLAPCLALALVVWLPFEQIQEVLALAGLDDLSLQVLSLGWNLLVIVPHGITMSLVCSLVGDAMTGGGASLGSCILRGLRRAPGAIVILFLTHIATAPLAFLCIAPYFLAQWLTWATVPVFVLEEDRLLTPAERERARANPLVWLASSPRRIARAIRRSLRLSSGAPALGRWLLLAFVGQFLFAGLLELGATALNMPEAREYLRTELGLGGGAAEFALAAAATPFHATASCVRAALMLAFYLDLRARREGLDLELALGRRERSAAPVPVLAEAGGWRSS